MVRDHCYIATRENCCIYVSFLIFLVSTILFRWPLKHYQTIMDYCCVLPQIVFSFKNDIIGNHFVLRESLKLFKYITRELFKRRVFCPFMSAYWSIFSIGGSFGICDPWCELNTMRVFPGGWGGKESICNERDLGSIPGLGRSPREGKNYPLQYPCIKYVLII